MLLLFHQLHRRRRSGFQNIRRAGGGTRSRTGIGRSSAGAGAGLFSQAGRKFHNHFAMGKGDPFLGQGFHDASEGLPLDQVLSSWFGCKLHPEHHDGVADAFESLVFDGTDDVISVFGIFLNVFTNLLDSLADQVDVGAIGQFQVEFDTMPPRL